MKHIIIAAAAAAVFGIAAAPAAQAEPIFCQRHGVDIYITACAPGYGGGGPDPFFARLHDPVTGAVVKNPSTGKTIKVCKSACSKLSPEDRIQND